MSRRIHRVVPACEQVEARALLSGVIASLATHPTIRGHVSAAKSGDSGLPQSQGPLPGSTTFLFPTGTPTPKEVKRETFSFTMKGPYVVGPGRFSSQILTTYIRGAAKSNYFFEGDGQLGLAVPTDASALVGGEMTFFDRNINANTVFGFDLAGSQANVDAQGRPKQLTLSTDVNISSGIWVESLSQGLVNIRYVSNGKHTPGVIDQGTAYVTVRGTAYTLGTANLLANISIDP